MRFCLFLQYAWNVQLKDTKVITVTNAFRKFLDESGCKPNKIWLDQGSEFYNRSFKSRQHDNSIEIYSTHNKGKSERFITTQRSKVTNL